MPRPKQTPQPYDALRVLRESLKMTQTEIGELIGCSTSAYSKREAHTVPFTLDEAVRIKNYINKKLKKDYTLEQIFANDTAIAEILV